MTAGISGGRGTRKRRQEELQTDDCITLEKDEDGERREVWKEGTGEKELGRRNWGEGER